MADLNQITVNVNDIIPPDNFATVDAGSKIGSVYTKEQDNAWRKEVEAATQSGIKGEAIPSTIPTPWASGQPDLYEKYDVKVAGTFTNFKDSGNNSIVISSGNLNGNLVQLWVKNGVTEVNLKAMPQAKKSIVNFSDIPSGDFPLQNSGSEKVQTINNGGLFQLKDGEIATILDVPGDSYKWKFCDGSDRIFNVKNWGVNLITGITSGYWGVTNTAQHNSSTQSKTNMITIDFTSFVLSGVTAAQITATGSAFNIRYYKADGTMVSTLYGTDFNIPNAVAGGWRFIPPADAKFVAASFNNGMAATIVLKTGEFVGQETEYKFKLDLIPDGTFLKKSEIINVPIELINLFTSGYFNSSATNKTTITASSSIYRTNFVNVVKGSKYIVQNIGNTTLGYNPFITFFDINGDVVGRINGNALTVVTGGYSFIVPNDDRIIECVFTVNVNERTLSVKKGNSVTEVNYGLLKPELLPESTSPVVDSSGSVVALDFFNRGNSPLQIITKKKAFLIIGQSNAHGRADSVEQPQWFIDSGRILPYVKFTNSSNGVFSNFNLASNDMFAFDLELFKKINTKISSDFYAIKLAVGGTSISTLSTVSSGYWTPKFEDIPTGKRKLSLEFKTMILNAIKTAGTEFEIVGVLMHQGESDKVDVDNYYQNLKNVISFLRGVVNNPTLPFFLGGISTKSTDWRYGVENAKVRLDTEDAYVHYVPVTNDISLLKSDVLHFNAAGNLDLANSFFDKMVTTTLI
ncbi:hypothetical protein AB670_00011 [Chryseobacterium sp. MOF25P]|uniref:sialate O-acetylesterase n=1 Tax=unclassified Chryseobacterium TaxID=2593645 RepID=UPI000805376A|nr:MULTISPECIES: sialate O-acetylesterase [unclassified Chryseobacterium]OBW43482.1 hypothetical protein AB670_00011 [Chryseobacterium sp. MOF25P]OBW46744.1 hypothetical protein AB671_01240 [Chryseobacterium sp. BGARF1]